MDRIILKILFLFFISQFLYGQISPGDLSEAHKDLEGMSNCTKCHELGEKVENKKCLDCHKEINITIVASSGFHGSADLKGKECVECHSDHFGRDFEIIRFDEDKFDHSKTKFELIGKHVTIKCEECHTSKHIKVEKLKEKKKSFLGLETSCESCHEDYHRGTLSSNNCVDCHNTEAWRPAPLFIHETAKFKLIGAHQNVDCEKCHAKEILDNKEFQKFTGLKFNNCVDCHNDIHKGKFGDNCIECHTEQSFKTVKNLKSFDHSKTNFQLIGKHVNVTCNKCHSKGITAKLRYNKCNACHTDFHKGEFVKEGKREDCSSCHNEYGFSPSLFTIEKHSNAKFLLSGGHSAVPCNECHYVESKWRFKFQNIECETCHNDIHNSSINYEGGLVSNCETCHSTEKWSAISFDHNKTKFELIGKHSDVSCSKCHFVDVKTPHQFIDISTKCENCHSDKHAGQFVIKYENNCSQCHSPTSWLVENFDHSNTRFIMDGAHKNVKCAECHKVIEKEGRKLVQYKFDDITCKNCHT